MATVGLGVADRDVGPGQGVERGEQCWLVGLDAEVKVRVPSVQVVGGATLGVQRVGADGGSGDVQGVEQFAQHGDLVGLRADLNLGGHQTGAGHRGPQVRLVAVGVFRSAQGLAVHNELAGSGGASTRRRRRRSRSVEMFALAGALEQPGADRGVGLPGIDLGHHPPDRALRRCPARCTIVAAAGVQPA